MGRFARQFGKWFAGLITFILTLYFVALANFKLVAVLLNNIGVSYWDFTMPIFVAYFLVSFWVFIVKGQKGLV